MYNKYVVENNSSMKKILVIGSSGLLGSRIIEVGRNSYEMFGTYSKHKTDAENDYHLDSLNRKQINPNQDMQLPDCICMTILSSIRYLNSSLPSAASLN